MVESDSIPAGPLIVDTNVFSFLHFRKGPWLDFSHITRGHILAISFATHGEALAGGYQKGLAVKRLTKIQSALSQFIILPYDRKVAEIWAPLYGKLHGHLKGHGINDLWTASCALAQNPPLPVVTDDLTDFEKIKNEREDLIILHPKYLSLQKQPAISRPPT